MARTITFKNPEHRINIGGQVIGPHNITPELYDFLVQAGPSHADLFNVVEDEPAKDAKPAKGKATE